MIAKNIGFCCREGAGDFLRAPTISKKERHSIWSALFLFLEEYSVCFQYIFVYHISGFKMHDLADDLQCSTHTEYGNDCADANGAAQQPADEEGDADHDGLYYANGGSGEAFAQCDQQGITGAAALCRTHIEILSVTHDEQTNNDHDAADRDIAELRHGYDAVDKVNVVAYQQGIQNRAVADFFLQQNVNAQDDDADDGMDDAITHPYPIGCTHGETVPRCQTDIRFYGQIYANGKDKEPEGGFQYFLYHLCFRLHKNTPVLIRKSDFIPVYLIFQF